MRLGTSHSRAYRRTSTWLLTLGVLATLVLAGFSALAVTPVAPAAARAGAPAASPAAANAPSASTGGAVSGAQYLSQLESAWHGTPTSSVAVPSAAVPSVGSALSYSAALAAVLAVSTGFDNASGWAAIAAGGIAPTTPMSVDASNITGGCAVSWINGTLTSIDIPATPISAAQGTSNFYFFYLVSPNATGVLLAGTVVNGSAALLFSFNRTSCPSQFPPFSPIPASVLDSPAIVARANASGGATFFGSFHNANRQWMVIGPANFSGFLEAPLWDVNFSDPCGASFEAVFEAISGLLDYTQTTLACQYQVTFEATGLANGTSWSLIWNGTSFLGASNGSAEVQVPNGTYPFSVFNVSGYSGTPLSGNVTVAGANVTQTIAFTLLPGNYTVSFLEDGLPNGTFWSVIYSGVGFSSSTGTTIAFATVNGSYTFSALAYGFAATPASGFANVSGANVTVNITFVALPMITFAQTGLPSLTSWTVLLNGSSGNGGFDGSNVTFFAPNGTYSFNVSGPNGFQATPSTGSVTVTGANVTVNVTFALAPGNYTVSFNETGLPAYAFWAVTFFYDPNMTNYSVQAGFAPNPIVFAAANGSYNWSLDLGVPGFEANVSNGSVAINGSNVTVNLTFTAVDFNVTFTESGLAAGTAWSVTVGSDTQVGIGTTINFSLPNGSYTYTVSAVPNYTLSAGPGNFTVNNGSANVAVTYTLVTYQITFTESGLAASTSWSVTIGAATVSSTSTTLTFAKANGTFSYTVDAVAGYTASPASGPLVVNGGTVSVTITFSVYTLPVTFTESGLPLGTSWSVTIGATTHQSTTTTIVFLEANGSYTYSVAGIAGFTASSTGGPVTVAGSSVGISLTFTVSKYAVTFSETGLPSGTNWSVTFNGTTAYSTSGSIVFHVPNATYAFSVGSVSGYKANATNGNVSVQGAAKTVALSFGSSAASPGFLGLPGQEGYYLLGAVVALIVILAGAGMAMRSRRMRKERQQKEEAIAAAQSATASSSASQQQPPKGK